MKTWLRPWQVLYRCVECVSVICGNYWYTSCCTVASDKPVFTVSSSSYMISVLEHQLVNINVTADGNPASIFYSWYSGRLLDKFIADGPVLTLRTVTRQDAGSLVCVASNSEGSTTLPVTLDVQCKNIPVVLVAEPSIPL